MFTSVTKTCVQRVLRPSLATPKKMSLPRFARMQTLCSGFCTRAKAGVSTRKFTSGSNGNGNGDELPLSELVRDFLSPQVFFDALQRNGHSFFAGVPDSLLKDLCAYITDNVADEKSHVITPNEGSAVALASGYHMATGKVPVVYMQNSGIGNSVNPLLSLSDRKVCEVPLLLLVGWRGEPGRKDEPQHMVQGKATTAILADLGIPFEILPDFEEGAIEALQTAHAHFQSRNSPYCLLVRKRTFESYKLKTKAPMGELWPTRRAAIGEMVAATGEWDAFVATTGFTARELYEVRKARAEELGAKKTEAMHSKDFLTVGSMGHSSAIALGVAMSKPSRNVFCLDGDGSALMHMGSLSMVGTSKQKNYKHVLLNNGVHDSVGQQPTVAGKLDFLSLATACGYSHVEAVDTLEAVGDAIKRMAAHSEGPAFLEIKTKPGAKKDLGRPKETPKQNKLSFMEFLRY